MATKIKLGARPKTLVRTVTFAMPEGGDGCMELQFKYRTRKQLAQLTDEVQAVAKAQIDADTEAMKAKIEKGETVTALTQSDIVDRDISIQVDYVLKAAEGWNLDEKFDRAAVEQLADEVPSAIGAIIDTYRKAINEGRSGN